MVTKLDAKISKKAKDIIQKYTSALFKDTSLEFYGIKTARIKELINVELPVVEVAESSTDFIFLLEDNTYLHVEFQTTYNKSDLTRFAVYDLRLYERDKRDINTVIIYIANIKEASTALNIGTLEYNPQVIMMHQYDGDKIFNELEQKLLAGQELSDIDMLNLIFLPLMRNNVSKEDLAVKSINLAKTIPDKTKQNTCIASIFAFASRYLDENKINDLLEVLRMTDLVALLVEDAVQDAKYNEKTEIARNALKEGLAIDFVQRLTGLDISTIKELQAE